MSSKSSKFFDYYKPFMTKSNIGLDFIFKKLQVTLNAQIPLYKSDGDWWLWFRPFDFHVSLDKYYFELELTILNCGLNISYSISEYDFSRIGLNIIDDVEPESSAEQLENQN